MADARTRAAGSVKLVTKTYGPDLGILAEMLEGLREVGSDMEHVVVVDDEGLPEAERCLTVYGVELMPTSAVLPRALRYLSLVDEWLRSGLAGVGTYAAHLDAQGVPVEDRACPTKCLRGTQTNP